MNNLEEEYNSFKTKVTKLGKDFNEEVSKLSPENLKRFKKEMKEILPYSLINLSKNLNN